MAIGHHKNLVSPADLLRGDRLAPQAGNVAAQLPHDFDRVGTGRLPGDSPDAGRFHFDLPLPVQLPAAELLRHWATANIAGADKNDSFHQRKLSGKKCPRKSRA